MGRCAGRLKGKWFGLKKDAANLTVGFGRGKRVLSGAKTMSHGWSAWSMQWGQVRYVEVACDVADTAAVQRHRLALSFAHSDRSSDATREQKTAANEQNNKTVGCARCAVGSNGLACCAH